MEVSKEQLLAVLDAVVKKTMTMDLTWEWPCGVAYYGICCAHGLTGRQEYLDFLTRWTDKYMELGLPEWNVNTCAMGHAMLSLSSEESSAEIVSCVIFWKLGMKLGILYSTNPLVNQRISAL